MLIFSVIDTMLYTDTTFDGMKLAGIIIICFGFLVVLFPENWPDALHKLIRYEIIFNLITRIIRFDLIDKCF